MLGPFDRDIDSILQRRHDNGADFWATADGRIYVGNPFSTLSSLGMLFELDVPRQHNVVSGALNLVLSACREDGRIQMGPGTPLHPCYTAEAARTLCRFGLSEHPFVSRTREYLIENTYDSGGWRCNFTKFGKGPETHSANPGATLYVLDVMRYFPEYQSGNVVANRAVQSLLDHWVTRKPTGPCHWGIGSSFVRVEFPFLRYNLFYFVYVLSFFERAREDPRFTEALSVLESKRNNEGQLVVEHRHRGLKGLQFCERGHPSSVATRRFLEVLQNVN